MNMVKSEMVPLGNVVNVAYEIPEPKALLLF